MVVAQRIQVTYLAAYLMEAASMPFLSAYALKIFANLVAGLTCTNMPPVILYKRLPGTHFHVKGLSSSDY